VAVALLDLACRNQPIERLGFFTSKSFVVVIHPLPERLSFRPHSCKRKNIGSALPTALAASNLFSLFEWLAIPICFQPVVSGNQNRKSSRFA
jgi:hypothetical protein